MLNAVWVQEQSEPGSEAKMNAPGDCISETMNMRSCMRIATDYYKLGPSDYI